MPAYFILKAIAVTLRLLSKFAPKKKPHPDGTLDIPSRDQNRTIRVHVYQPPGAAASSSPTSVLINFSGSGFVLRGHGLDDEFCRYIAENTNHTVFDVDYRLAPEHPFPAALEDAADVVNYVKTLPQTYDQNRISISGFSAGGNIAVSVAMNHYAPNDFHAVIAFYPPVNASIDPKSKVAPVPIPRGGSVPLCLLRFFQDCYLCNGTDPKDPRVSPHYAPMDSFPNTSLWVTAEHDNLAVEAEQLANEGLKDPNRHVQMLRVPKCGHAWDKFAKNGTPQADAKRSAYEMARDILVQARPSRPKPSTGTGPSGTTQSSPEAGPSGASQSPKPGSQEPESKVSIMEALSGGPPESKTEPVPVPGSKAESLEQSISPPKPLLSEESPSESPAKGKGKARGKSPRSPSSKDSGDDVFGGQMSD